MCFSAYVSRIVDSFHVAQANFFVHLVRHYDLDAFLWRHRRLISVHRYRHNLALIADEKRDALRHGHRVVNKG